MCRVERQKACREPLCGSELEHQRSHSAWEQTSKGKREAIFKAHRCPVVWERVTCDPALECCNGAHRSVFWTQQLVFRAGEVAVTDEKHFMGRCPRPRDLWTGGQGGEGGGGSSGGGGPNVDRDQTLAHGSKSAPISQTP